MLLAARAGEQRACATANPRLPLGTAESLAQGSRQLRRVVAARLGRGTWKAARAGPGGDSRTTDYVCFRDQVTVTWTLFSMMPALMA